MKRRGIFFLVLSILLGTSQVQLSSQILLTAPEIPEHEVLTYRRTTAGKVTPLKVTWDLVREKAGSWYEVHAVSTDQDARFRLDSHNLFGLSSDLLVRTADSTLRRTSTVMENRAKPGEGELLVGSPESLVYELRGFPWGKVSKARLVFLGSGGGGGNFSFDLTVMGKESVDIGGSAISCWKAQLGLGGVFGSLMGKTTLWYSADPAHYLVRSEGASGPPGSPMVSLLLQERK